jgi:hypothetical protein
MLGTDRRKDMTAIASIEGREAEPAVTGTECPTHRLTVAEFERMVAAGVFGETEPVYLWEGRFVEKTTKGDDHDYALTGLNTLLVRIVPAGWHVRPETPMQILDRGLPKPDLTVARGSYRDYKGRKPTAQDVALNLNQA